MQSGANFLFPLAPCESGSGVTCHARAAGQSRARQKEERVRGTFERLFAFVCFFSPLRTTKEEKKKLWRLSNSMRNKHALCSKATPESSVSRQAC